jgi:ComF family protein
VLNRCLADRLPGDCRVCRQWGAGTLCAACTQRFAPLRHRCPRCALSLPQAAAAAPACAACLGDPPAWRRAVCAQDYDFPWSGLIADFKFRGDVGLAGLLAQRLACAVLASPGARDVDVVLPVPLSPQRLLERGFNQAWELTRRLGARLHLPIAADLLQRPMDTAHQVDLSLQDRARNLRGAFMATPQRQAAIAGRRLALVDDVMTTGATLRSATHTLLQAGAASVDVWAVARTP